MSDPAVLLHGLWEDLHSCLEPYLVSRFDDRALGEAVAVLRQSYRAMNENGNSPNFNDPLLRAGYSLAYHPAHAYAYFHILLRRRIGHLLFDGVAPGLSTLVLGAGCGAETLAAVHWFKRFNPHLLDSLRIKLVDRADWADTRIPALATPIEKINSGLSSRISHVQIDLATDSGREAVAKIVSDHDLIFCPALFTELISQNADRALAEILKERMKKGARLVVVDQGFVNRFNQVKNGWFDSGEMTFLNSDQMVFKGLEIPRPPDWAIERFFSLSGNNRIPVRYYSLSWIVAQKR